MPTFRSIAEYRKTLKLRKKRLSKGGMMAAKQASKIAKRLMLKTAPHSSGQTKSGIRRYKKKQSWIVESGVPGAFKQNLFANMREPYKKLHFGPKGGGMAYAPNQTVMYGRPALSRSGKQIRWTAKGPARKIGFFNFAALETRKKFPNLSIKIIRKILKSK